MCVIVVQPAGEELSGNKFRNCWDRNSHGGGYSYVDDGKVLIKKGFFKVKTMLEHYREDREKYEQSPFIVHFRISTSGKRDQVNTHPHRVRDDLVVAHNGHISGYGDQEQSDTLEFVSLILQKMPQNWEDDDIQRHLIEEYIRGDKMAFLRGDGQYFILNEKAGWWEDELWFSNKSYEKLKSGKAWTGNSKGKNTVGQAPLPGTYIACGWESADTWDDVTQPLEGTGYSVGEYPLEYSQFFNQPCAYCDTDLEQFDALLAIEVEAWYPICSDCMTDSEKQLTNTGVIADCLDEAWEIIVDRMDKEGNIEIEEAELHADVVEDEAEEKEDETPATTRLLRLTANVFSS